MKPAEQLPQESSAVLTGNGLVVKDYAKPLKLVEHLPQESATVSAGIVLSFEDDRGGEGHGNGAEHKGVEGDDTRLHVNIQIR